MALYFLLIIPAQILFLSFVVYVVSAYFTRWISETHVALVAGFTFIGIAAAVHFWIALWWIDAGNLFRVLCAAAVLWACVQVVRRKLYSAEMLVPVGLMAGTSALLCALIYLRTNPDDMLRSVATIWRPMPIDNEIPFRFAMGLWNGKIDIPLIPGWHASDRPPLQSSLFLLLQAGVKPNAIRYEVCSIVLQMTAIPALWAVLRTVRVGQWASVAIAVIAFLTPMSIMNGVFVWPKLIAVTFLCCAAVALLSDLHSRRPVATAAIVGASLALAFLCHGTSAFTFPAYAIVALMRIRTGTFRFACISALALVLLYVPWMGFQKFYDPPGDRLLKWHFAGAQDVTDEPLSSLLKKAYADKSLAKVYEIRKFGVTDVVFGLIPETYSALGSTISAYIRGVAPPAQMLVDLRDREFLRMIPSMGVIGLLSPILLFAFFIGRLRPLAIIVFGTLIFWVATVFDPFQMIPHSGSYIMQFFAIGAVGAILALITPWLLLPLALVHALAVASVYLI